VRHAKFRISKLDKSIVKEIIADSRNIMLHSFGNQLANGYYPFQVEIVNKSGVSSIRGAFAIIQR
ncbi:MAG: hypothetical protein NTW25_04970, partial [Candidatus Kapabacteria bacterium]|nr:hypothetical protein [Candidatus Kapabacteria bacterium]